MREQQDPTIDPLSDIAGVVCDLDGVVYHGPRAVPGAADALAEIRQRTQVLFATNNASRTPETVAAQLRELAVEALPEQVLTSATVGAQVLAERLRAGAPVLAVGGEGVLAALRAVGLDPVVPSTLDLDDVLPAAVLQGYGPEVRAADLATAAFVVASGADWIATNTDWTLPTDRGTAPGNGTLVAAVTAATDRTPEVVGKPGPLLYERAAVIVGAPPARMLGVGDRLETDIAGAHAAGMRAAAVLTGVHGAADLAAASRELRPELVVADLAALLQPYRPASVSADAVATCGGASARWRGASLELEGADGIERLRAALGCVWTLQDDGALTPAVAAEAVASSVGGVEI